MDSSGVTAASVENEVRTGLKLGTSVSAVDQFLAERKIEHSFNADSKITYAAVRQLRGSTLIARQTLTFRFHFDDNLRLVAIET